MLILLPPSEGKAPTNGGTPFDVEELSTPALNRTRVRVRDALVKLCSGREARARQVLGISARQTDELDRNRELADARALPVSEVYTGVLYAALDYPSLTATARKRADRWVLVSSALWGVVRLDDEIASRAVVSHHNKATKGHLVRALASQGTTPRSVEELAALVEKLGFGTELSVGRPGKPWSWTWWSQTCEAP